MRGTGFHWEREHTFARAALSPVARARPSRAMGWEEGRFPSLTGRSPSAFHVDGVGRRNSIQPLIGVGEM